MITLTDGIDLLILNHLVWTDRIATQIAGSERATMGPGGSLIVQRFGPVSGGDVTLEAKLENNVLKGWFTTTQVEKLELWRDNGDELVLNYDGVVMRTVIPVNPDGLDLTPVLGFSRSPRPADKWHGQLTMKRL